MDARLRSFFEVYPPQPQATVPVGIRVNEMVYAGAMDAADPVTGAVSGDVRQQMRVVLGKLETLLADAGASLDNVARAACFVTRVEDRGPADEVWMDVFPDPQDKPAFKVLLADLPEGHLVRLEALALVGARRQRIDIPNVAAHDPTVKVGNWLFSSRCHANDPATGQIVEGGVEAQTRQTLANLVTLAKLAGGDAANIRQVTMFGRDASYMAAARRSFEERFPDPATRPALNQLVNFVSGRFEVAIEMAAVL